VLDYLRELELLRIIQNPKVQVVIERIWNSDYDTSGSIFSGSTCVKIMNSPLQIDQERETRFYKPRKAEKQHNFILEIYKNSMKSWLLVNSIILFAYLGIAVWVFGQTVTLYSEQFSLLDEVTTLSDAMNSTTNSTLIEYYQS